MSVQWPSKYAKIHFRPWLCPGPRCGSWRRCPRPLSRLGRGHNSPYPTLLGTDPPSALAIRPPRSPAYAYGNMGRPTWMPWFGVRASAWVNAQYMTLTVNFMHNVLDWICEKSVGLLHLQGVPKTDHIFENCNANVPKLLL